MRVQTIDPAVQHIADIPFTSWLRNRTGLDEFFTYRLMPEDRWVVALWWDKNKGQFRDVWSLHPGQPITRKDVEAIEDRTLGTRGGFHKLLRSEVVSAARKHTQELIEGQETWNEQKRFLRRKGFDHPGLKKGTLTE